MKTAFGQAMIATVSGQPQTFRMTMHGQFSMDMDCCDFLSTRPEENQLLGNLKLPEQGTVLDVGCGVGRHLMEVRRTHPQVHCFGIDICDLMLDHCLQTVSAPATFARNLEAVSDHRFDLIMLMGNGLGVLGQEADAVAGLRTLASLLKPSGRILIETGNPFGKGYFSGKFINVYGGNQDGPFYWGYSDREWITKELQSLNCVVNIQPSKAPGGVFFFAIGQKSNP